MKRAFQYLRISDEDQSYHSIDGQSMFNQNYARKHDIEILETFTDDGYSAKDFNRPDWKRLEKALEKRKNEIDYLIVWRYDRLIRNVLEGLNFIEKLEKKWNIRLISVMESTGDKPDSAEFFRNRVNALMSAEYERRQIAVRTKLGVWSARSQGRYTGVAPIGFLNKRDQDDKPIIVVDHEKKHFIAQIFSDFLGGISFPLIRHKLSQQGFPLKGNDTLTRILTTHTYAGLIAVPAFMDWPEDVVKGIHEPIVPEKTFWAAYHKIQDKIRSQVHKVIDENLPMRGFILCQSCGGQHTGSKSRGRSSHYYYYRCKKCPGENHNADKVHEEIHTILKNLSLDGRYTEALKAEVESQFAQALEYRGDQFRKLNKETQEAQTKLDSIEGKYFSGKIDDVTFEKWNNLIRNELKNKTAKLEELQAGDNENRKILEDILPLLTDLKYIYSKAGVTEKQKLLKEIFWGGYTREKTGGRIGMLNPMFLENSPEIRELLKIANEGSCAA